MKTKRMNVWSFATAKLHVKGQSLLTLKLRGILESPALIRQEEAT